MDIINQYFEWLYHFVCDTEYSKLSYRKLLMCLHDVDFEWLIDMDENRAQDGVDLRDKFIRENRYRKEDMDYFKPCSVLEMMVALAIRAEQTIMDDPDIGDRTGQWFWGMISSLGLGRMDDRNFNRAKTMNIIDRFLDRQYEPNGRGGLFTLPDCRNDLRDVDIWYQLNWYLNDFV